MYISNFSKNFINLNPALFQSTRSISNELLKILAREQPLPPPSQKRSGRNGAGGLYVNSTAMEMHILLIGIKDKS